MKESEFSAHRLWRIVQDVITLTDAPEHERSLDTLEAIQTTRWIAQQVQAFSAFDPRFYSMRQIDEAAALWQDVYSHLIEYRESPMHEYVLMALSAAERCFEQMGAWHRPPMSSNALSKQAKQEYSSLRKESEHVISELRRQLEFEQTNASRRAAETAGSIEMLESAAKIAHQDLKNVQEQLRVEKQRLEEAFTNHDEIFRRAQASRDSEFTKWIKNQLDSLSNQTEPFLEDLQNQKDSGEETLKEIRSLGDQTKVAAGQTTGHILAEKFESSSQSELDSGNRTFWIGIGVALAGVAWLVIVAILTFGDRSDFNWNWLGLKISLAVALGGVATILIRKGQQALTSARTYKRTELELRSIGPFLSDIGNKAMAEEAKVDFLKRTFGRSEGNGSNDNSEAAFGAKALDVLSTVVERLPKA
ncbi:hypothetical protein [Pseudarthrobacter sp. MM222]|uniref:hypothetical protein n=1 Tax=Pseudarthrobacter sp. MM222 TaxID=3018929 RepID=UPI00221F845B|nr:hypothetical protein [Pseudarthrobacter sp. MM222]CAI3804424.1 hypothetical protein NKCBBBOE_03596 [Pseudarthrobacter sp. MM222]